MPYLMSYLIGFMNVSNINAFCFHRMNTRRTIGQRRGDNQVPSQAPAEGVVMPVNPAGLTDAEVQAYLA